MTHPVQLRWMNSLSVSCFHSADAILSGRELVDPAVGGALAAPVENLRAALADRQLDPQDLFQHLVPLATLEDSLLWLAEVALTKAAGRTEAERLMITVQGLLAD